MKKIIIVLIFLLLSINITNANENIEKKFWNFSKENCYGNIVDKLPIDIKNNYIHNIKVVSNVCSFKENNIQGFLLNENIENIFYSSNYRFIGINKKGEILRTFVGGVDMSSYLNIEGKNDEDEVYLFVGKIIKEKEDKIYNLDNSIDLEKFYLNKYGFFKSNLYSRINSKFLLEKDNFYSESKEFPNYKVYKEYYNIKGNFKYETYGRTSIELYLKDSKYRIYIEDVDFSKYPILKELKLKREKWERNRKEEETYDYYSKLFIENIKGNFTINYDKNNDIEEDKNKIIKTSYKNSSVVLNLRAKGNLLKLYKKVGKGNLKKGKESIKKILNKKISEKKAKKIFENISSKFSKLAYKDSLSKKEIINIKKYITIIYLFKDAYNIKDFSNIYDIKRNYFIENLLNGNLD